MRQLPPERTLAVDFAGEAFAAAATIAFAADAGPGAGPARHVTVQAGRRGTWTIRFAPRGDLPPGSKVALAKIENSFRFAWRHQDYWPDAMDYVTVADGQGRPLPFVCDTCGKSKVPAVVTLPDGLAAGETVVVRLGDRRGGGPGSYVQPNGYARARIAAGVVLPGDDACRPAPDAQVSVTVVPCPPVRRYYLYAPAAAAPGQPLAPTVMPVDINGNVMDAAPGAVVPGPDGGPPAAPPTEGVCRLTLRDEASGLTAESNPIRVGGGPFNVYWGELHSHSYDGHELNVLNADTDPDRLYRYGRDVTRLDFCGLSPHVFREVPDLPRRWWGEYLAAAQRHDEPGRYVTFVGCEWRDAEAEGGDRNLIWRRLDPPVPDPTWKVHDVHERMRGAGMVIPHVGGAIAVPCRHDGRVETLCEMVSGHGQFEWFAQAYLAQGCKVGLVGSSDGHNGTPGHPRRVMMSGGRFWDALRRRDSGWGGGPVLAALAERLDRDCLWQAMRARRVYASTGARGLLDFRINGAVMGSEIAADREVAIEVSVDGTAAIECVDLIRGDRRVARFAGGEAHFEAQLADLPPDGQVYYYVRVEQRDGELLWSSPIWVDSTCGGTDALLPAWNQPEPAAPQADSAAAAAAHLPDLIRYLRTEENMDAFSAIVPWKVVDSPMGAYAVFLAKLRGHRIRIHWFYEFEMPRLRLEAGDVQYGSRRIMGEKWARSIWQA